MTADKPDEDPVNRSNASLGKYFQRQITANSRNPLQLPNFSSVDPSAASSSILTAPSSNSIPRSSEASKPPGPLSRFASLRGRRQPQPSSLDDPSGLQSGVNEIFNLRARHLNPEATEDKFQLETIDDSPYALLPDGKIRQYWDMYVLVLLMYVATVSVFVYSFNGVLGLDSPFFWIERFLDISFAVDIILNFFTAYERHGRVVKNLGKIQRRYLATWFVPDVLSTFPWDTIALANAEDDSKPSLLQLPRYIRLVRLFKLFRLLHFLRLKESFTNWEVKFRLKDGYVRIGGLVFTVVLLSHWFGCLFFYFGSILPVSESWIEGVPDDLYGKYIQALYFSVYTITTIGYGDTAPVNTLERSYVTIIMLFGAACFAYVISQVSTIAGELNATSSHQRIMMDSLTDLARSRDLPEELVLDIRKQFRREHQRQRVVAESELLQGISKDLRVEVLKNIYGTHIERSRLFENVPNENLNDVYEHLTEKFARKDERLFSESDRAECFYIIIKGSVELCDAGDDRIHLGDGDIFGENDIIFHRQRKGTAICKSYTDLVVVPRDAVMDTLRRHPRALKRLRDEEALWKWDEAVSLVEQQIQFAVIARTLRQKGEAHMRKKGRTLDKGRKQDTKLISPRLAAATQTAMMEKAAADKAVVGQAAAEIEVAERRTEDGRMREDRQSEDGSGAGSVEADLESKNEYIAKLEQRLSMLQHQLDSIVSALKQGV